MTNANREWTKADDTKLATLADKIKGRDAKLETTIRNGRMEIAKCLTQAQELMAVPGCKSQFGAWVESLEIDLKKSSAYNYIDVYKCFGKCEHAAQFAWTAMIRLAGDDKQEARNTALKEAEQGQRITGKLAKELIDRHAPQGSGSTEAIAEPMLSEESQEQPREAAETATVEPVNSARAGDTTARKEPFVYHLGDSRIILEPAKGVNSIELHKQAAAYLIRKYQSLITRGDELGSMLMDALENDEALDDEPVAA